jgi:hypothetical protein
MRARTGSLPGASPSGRCDDRWRGNSCSVSTAGRPSSVAAISSASRPRNCQC